MSLMFVTVFISSTTNACIKRILKLLCASLHLRGLKIIFLMIQFAVTDSHKMRLLREVPVEKRNRTKQFEVIKSYKRRVGVKESSAGAPFTNTV